MTMADRPLPHWPALMDEATAAAYCSCSGPTFRALTSKFKVQPISTDFRLLRWRKTDIDAMIDRLPTRGVPSTPEAVRAVESLDEARKRARKRRR